MVNSVSKQGTNQFHGSAFVFWQDESLTSKDYFAEQGGFDKPQTQQQQWGGTVGGPIIQNKMHFFGSLERIVLDGGVTTQIPSRPDLERTDFEETRVWNTFARFDHQLNANQTWGLRWLRETSPQPIQINAENHTPPRYEAETDVDWTLVASLSSVLGSNKVNTFRVSAVSEDVFFGNPLFNESRIRSRCFRSSTSSASRTSRALGPTAAWTSPTARTTSSRGSCRTRGAAATT